jgi:hypothetical protein
MSTLSTPAGDITYTEMEDSTRYRVGQRGIEATRKFWVQYASLSQQTTTWKAFSKALMGYHKFVGGAGNGTVSHEVPAIPLPDFPNCFCTEVFIDPLQPDSPGGQASSDMVKSAVNSYTNGMVLTARYETMVHKGQDLHRKFDIDVWDNASATIGASTGTFLWLEADFGGEIYVAESGTFRWVDEPATTITDTPVGITVPSAQFVIDWWPVIHPPWTAIRENQGCVNDAAFLGYPAGCVLYQGCQPILEPRLYDEGSLYWRLKHRFAAQAKAQVNGALVGWNYLYKKESIGAGTDHWLEIENTDDAQPFLEGTFNDLFRYES